MWFSYIYFIKYCVHALLCPFEVDSTESVIFKTFKLDQGSSCIRQALSVGFNPRWLCLSTRLSLLRPGFDPPDWLACGKALSSPCGCPVVFSSGFLPPPERFKISSHKPVQAGRVLDTLRGR